MLENVLTKNNAASKTKITCKTLVSIGLIVLAVVLPQLVHLALGQLGWRWAMFVGVLSPLASFALTSLMGNPMPVLARLPFMMAELAVFAVVSGLFSNKIYKNGLWAFPAVLAAQLAGRAAFLGLAFIFQSVAPFTAEMIWSQILAGWLGLAIQLIAVPLIVIGLRAILVKEK